MSNNINFNLGEFLGPIFKSDYLKYLIVAGVVLIVIGILTQHKYSEIVLLLGILLIVVTFPILILAEASKHAIKNESKPIMPSRLGKKVADIAGIFLGYIILIVLHYFISQAIAGILPQPISYVAWLFGAVIPLVLELLLVIKYVRSVKFI